MEGPFSNIGEPPPGPKKAPTQKRTAQGVSAASRIIDQATAVAGDISDNMGMVLATALTFAKPDGRELVVDIEAFVSALLNVRAIGHVESAAGLLKTWAKEERLAFVSRNVPDTTNLSPTLSQSITGQVLPRAVALRDLTMGGVAEPIGLRHLLFALAECRAKQWPSLASGGHPAPEQLQTLQVRIIERATKSTLSAEDGVAWLALSPSERSLLPPKPPPAERTPLLSDNPAAVDELGRKPLADALAARLVRLQQAEAESRDPKAVMVHLHGPWGSGKSSLVRFLTDALERENPRWLVVEFNAWRNSRVKPPWWNMLTEFKRGLSRRLLAEAAQIRWILGDR